MTEIWSPKELVQQSRDGYKTPATPKMEFFVILVDG